MTAERLRANLGALPDLAWLDAIDDSPLIRLDGDEKPVLQVRTSREQWVALHGRHDPLRDARRVLDAAGIPAEGAVAVLIGGGAGHLAEVLLEERRARHVLVLEPHALAARTMLGRRDWRQALDARRLTLLVGPDYARASDAWRSLDGVDDDLVHVLEDAVLAREHEPLVARAREVLARVRFDAAANRQAREELGATYALQTLANLPEVVRSPSLRTLSGRAAGRHGVVLAAGPSLWRNLEGNAAWRDRVVVIAVDTAARTALAHGLEPDYIVAVDASQANARHLRGLGTLTRSWLVAEASLAPSALDVCGQRRTFFRVGDNVPWPWLVGHGLDVPRLAVWGSVLTAAYSLARYLSCATISLLGADLAFTSGQPYSRGVVFEHDWARQRLNGMPTREFWARQRRKRAVVEVPDVDGGRVLSAPHLLAFRDWLVERSASDEVELRNATGHGALLAPTIVQIEAGDLATLPMPSERFDPAPADGEPSSNQSAAHLERMMARGTRSRAELETALAAFVPAEDTPAAVDASSARLVDAPRVAAAPAPPAHLLAAAYAWLDERLAQWSAARAGRTPQWLLPTGAIAGADPDAGAADTLTAWLSRQHGLTRNHQAPASPLPPTLPPEVRLLMELPWHPDAEAAALALQALVARAASGRGTLPGRWRPDAAATPIASTAAGGAAARRYRERSARLAVMALRTHLAICRASANRDVDMDVCAAVLDGCRPDESDEPFVVRMRLTLPEGQLAAAGTIGSALLFSAIEGAVMPVSAPSPRALDFAWTDGPGLHARLAIRRRRGTGADESPVGSSPTAWLRPVWLTDRGLAPSSAAFGVAGGRHALLTPRGGRHSVIVDGWGQHSPLPTWPVALVTELPGPQWHVALSQAGSGLVCARRPDGAGPILDASITGNPYTAAWADAERVLVTSSTGVWEWTPGTQARLVAAVPPAAIVDVSDGRVRLDPIPIVGGRYQPRLLHEGWRVDLRDGIVTPQPLDAAGQAWSRTARGRVLATAHPEAHGIRFEAGTSACWLAWHRPRGVVWIDEHLLVWGADGRVALVRDAWPVLTAALGSTRPESAVTARQGRQA